MMIPKIFHYVWLGSQPMHPLMEEWQRKMQDLHPCWSIKTWREVDGLPEHLLTCGDEIVECRVPEYLRSCPTYAKKSDVWRYEILEQQGGVYLDTDMEPVRCLESLLESGVEAFAGLCDTIYNYVENSPNPIETGTIKTEVGCSIMGCSPHHPWAKELVKRTPNQCPVSKLSLAFPFLTAVTGKHPDVKLFPTEVFYPFPWHHYALRGVRSLKREPIPAGTYSVHRWSSCWFPAGLMPRSTTKEV
jgi:mannosyltransferase OCH1-like enzyme